MFIVVDEDKPSLETMSGNSEHPKGIISKNLRFCVMLVVILFRGQPKLFCKTTQVFSCNCSKWVHQNAGKKQEGMDPCELQSKQTHPIPKVFVRFAKAQVEPDWDTKSK